VQEEVPADERTDQVRPPGLVLFGMGSPGTLDIMDLPIQSIRIGKSIRPMVFTFQ
jgi:hypothetical protein